MDPYYVEALKSGYVWANDGNGVTLNYQFWTSLPSYYAAGDDEANGFEPFGVAMQEATTEILNSISTFANITFNEVTVEAEAQLGFAGANLPSGIAGWAYYPYGGVFGGDVWADTYYVNENSSEKGSFGYFVMLHEIGHALGLQHSFASGLLSAGEDNTRYSVMSYSYQVYAESFMIYDIAALQALYGANMGHATGDDVYVMDASAGHAIWDAGGIDTLDASAETRALTINLAPGTVNGFVGDVRVGIAYGVTIENFIGGSGNDTIIGNSADNVLNGGGGTDAITVTTGDDLINGGSGNDTAFFGAAFDSFVYSLIDDLTLSFSSVAFGTDTMTSIESFVFSDVTYSLAELRTMAGGGVPVVEIDGDLGGVTVDFTSDHLTSSLYENLPGVVAAVYRPSHDVMSLYVYPAGATGNGHLEFTAPDTGIAVTVAGTDDSLNMTFNGGAGNDRFTAATGIKGDDQIFGHDGDDTLDGGAGNDLIDGGEGNDNLYGRGGDDTLIGGIGNDWLRDDAGVNVLDGGAGDDWLLVSGGSNTLIGGDGNDYLAANNVLVGATSLSGGAGNDTMYGGADNDTLDGGDGNDYLSAYAGDDFLAGGAGVDRLYGGDGNDTIDGGTGMDRMYGGAGDDSFLVDNAGDIVYENPGEGTDEVQSSVSYALGTDVENLTLTGADNVNATGNSSANILTGNAGDNLIAAKDGDDTIIASAGNDMIDGGAGADTLVLGGVFADFTVGMINNVTLSLSSLAFGDDSLIGVETLIFDDVTYSFNDLRALAGGSMPVVMVDGTLGATLVDYDSTAYETFVVPGDVASITRIDDFAMTVTFNDIGGAGALTFIAPDTGITITLDGIYGTLDMVFNGNVGDDTFLVTTTIGGDAALYGGAGEDDLTGASGNDILDGGDDDDILDGGLGDDTLIGGNGDDWLMDDGGINSLDGGFGDDLIEGGTDSDTMTGGAGYDELLGNGGGDWMDGGDDGDWMEGGDGNDTLYGGLGDDGLMGDEGDDILYGGDDSDFIEGGNGSDTLYGGAGDDYLGSWDWDENPASVNYLYGEEGNDWLESWTANSYLYGGVGNDVYLVFFEASTVIENAGEGVDEVWADVDYTLSDNIEYLALIGDAVSATGNAMDNGIWGTEGDNVIDGGLGADYMAGDEGNDVYIVDNTGDVVVEYLNDGTDEVRSSVSVVLSANVENLVLTGGLAINGSGNGQNNVLTGNSSANFLDGAAGADAMIGGDGDDTYVVDNADDTVTENAGEGTDMVKSHLSYTLGANLENLVLMANVAAVNGTGNELDNTIWGNAFANTLDGGAGNDILQGGDGDDIVLAGIGDDVMDGEGGNDTLVFTEAFADLTFNSLAGGAGSVTGALSGTDAFAGFETFIFSDRSYSYAVLDSIVNAVPLPAVNMQLQVGRSVLDYNSTTISDYTSGDGTISISRTDIDALTVTLAGSKGSFMFSAPDEGIDISLEGAMRKLSASFTGGAGDDSMSIAPAIGGTAMLSGGAGNDTLISGGGKSNMLDGGEGDDTLTASGGKANSLNGGEGNDTLTASGGKKNFLDGGDGNDVVSGGAGMDAIYGGNGDDVLYGGGGKKDFLYGGAGSDTFVFNMSTGAKTLGADFTLFGPEADKIDISDVLTGFDPVNDAIADFVNIYAKSGKTYVQVSSEGNGSWITVGALAGSDFTGVTVDSLYASGQLIVQD